jgi:hypothetical protein
MVRHTFYIEHEDGTVLEWTGLSHRRAQTLLGYTQVCKPEGACRWGWYEEAHPVMGDEFRLKNLTNVREGAEQ